MAWFPSPVSFEGSPGEGIRVAVAGASHWHLPRHAANLRAAGCTFVAVTDPDPQIAARWATELGTAVVPDAGAIVSAKPDVVLALGRVSDMAAQASVFLEAGLPMLAEKPLGLSPEQVAPLMELEKRKGGWTSVALVQRYDPLWRVLDRLEAAGTLGDIGYAHMRIVNGPPQRYAAWGSSWMLDPATAGGGAMLNLGIHGMDYLRRLAGGAVCVTGAAIGRRMHNQKVEDFGTAVLTCDCGFVGTVEAGYTYPDASAGMTRSGDNETRIATQGAYLIGRDAELTLVTADGEKQVEGGREGDRYREWVFDSLARLRAGLPPVAGIQDCLEAVKLVFEAYRLAGA
jgi:predicted dehydrogenase